MKAQQMLVLTNMLSKIISQMDDLKAMMKEDGERHIDTIEDYMDQKWHSVKTRSQEYLLK